MTTDYPLVNALIFAALGVAVFFAAFGLLRRMLPGDLWKEIFQERNVALAVLAGFLSLGLAIIIAAAMH
jgi:uncharacterized membrane protein YjfL (UPF0719 family)